MAAGTEIASAYISLLVSMEGTKKRIEGQLGKVDSESVGEGLGDKLGVGISNRTAAIAGAVGGIVSSVATQAISGLAGLVGDAVAASDATDKFKKSLSFAGMDTTVIESVSKQARKYADDTVYDLGTIQNTTAQLAANGVKGFSDLTEAAGNLNAIAGGNNDTFSSVAMVLTQTAGAGKLTTENWNQLANAIPGASGVLIDSLEKAGAFTGNFRDAMAKGEISADEFNAALMKVGTDPIAVEAAKSTDTMEGAVGNLTATITGALSDAFTAIKPGLTGLVNGLADAIGYVQANIKWIGPLAAVIGATAIAYGIATTAGTLYKAYQVAAAASTGGLTIAQWALNAAMSANPIGLIVIAIGLLIGAIVLLVMNWDAVVGFLKGIWDGFVGWFTSVMDGFLGWWDGVWDGFLGFITDVWNNIVSFVTGYIKALQFVITTVVDLIVGWWNATWQGVADFVGGIWAGIVGFISAYITTVQTIITTVVGAIRTVWQNVWTGISDFFGGIWDGIVGMVKGAINAIIDMINGLTAGLNEFGSFLSDVTGGAVTFQIGKIPHLADGGTIRSAGSVLVGERGPEILNLPPGASVEPLDHQSGRDTGPIELSDASIDKLARAIDGLSRNRLRQGVLV